MAGVNSWFSIRIDILALVLMTCFSFVCVLSREETNPIILSMLLSYVLTIQATLT